MNRSIPYHFITTPKIERKKPTFANPINTNNLPNPRSSLILPAPPWRGSAVLPPSAIYETPTETPSWEDDDDKGYSTPKPDPYSDETWSPYPLPTNTAEPSPSTPRPSYSAIVSVRTTTWVVSHSTTITSVILETYYSTLTDYGDGSAEGGSGTVTVTTTSVVKTETESGSAASASDPCAAGGLSKYASECSSGTPVTTITWTPALTPYPLPSSSEDEGRAPASTSSTTTSTTTTTASTTTATEADTESPTGISTANESPPVVTGAATPLHNTNTRALAAAAALFAVLA
ncbi:hypothetical protein HDV57DRAFT_101274 [Trichoderma longibrachiatum]